MSLKKQPSSVALNVEKLESREVMAGNVSVYVSGSILYVRGDSSSNGIEIRQSGTDAYQVRGLTHGGSATKINGSTGTKIFTAVGDDVDVSLAGGNDRIDFLAANTGTGRHSLVKGDLWVFTGSGNDNIYMNKVHTWGSVYVNTGSGQDTTSIDNAHVRQHMTIEDTTVNNSGDWNKVWVYNSNIGYSTVQGKLTIDLYDGKDEVYLNNTVTSSLYVYTYGGSDYVSVSNCKVWQHLGELNGGGGTDTLRLWNNAGVNTSWAYNFEVRS